MDTPETVTVVLELGTFPGFAIGFWLVSWWMFKIREP